MGNFVYRDGGWVDLDDGCNFNGTRIAFIRHLRKKFGMDLEGAKLFSDHLVENHYSTVNIERWASARQVVVTVPVPLTVDFPSVPVSFEGTIHFGGVTYTASIRVNNLPDSIRDIKELVLAARALVKEYDL